MAKTKTSFYCQHCGYESAKWLGKCPSCASWNSFAEEVSVKPSTNGWKGKESSRLEKPRRLEEVDAQKVNRVSTGDSELDAVLGGGIVPGSLVLIGGEPGIGKSTLMLQVGMRHPGTVVYISGEESDHQIKLRAQRLGLLGKEQDFYVLTKTNNKHIFLAIEAITPSLIIIDSIQTLHSPLIEATAGSISQVRQCAGEWMKYSKETNTPVFLIGHITKDGMLAGPKVLEHMVDTVLQFEGDRHLTYRILRTAKNRFGSTAEMGIYEMVEQGLREVLNPSELLIPQKDGPLSGATIGATLEGNRPFLIEVQSLVTLANYGTPQRSTTGYDQKRLNMLLAVLEKRCGFRLGNQDVFLNMAGGIKVEDTAIDLAICISVISSLQDIPIADTTCFAAEIGLGGELRAVNKIDQRVLEAEKLGFKEIFVSRFHQKNLSTARNSIEVKFFGHLNKVFQELMG